MKRITFYLILLFATVNANSQMLSVRQFIQEQTEWCWVGVSQCVLDYYGKPYSQCEIAEYARSVITWRDFGSVDCCNKPYGLCNYWNYNWGQSGSIQDILESLGEVPNIGVGTSLTLVGIIDELTLSRPFIIRWGWKTGGGHFVVGHGLNENTLYYMDPWFGEGLKFASYDWVKDNDRSTWTHTNKMDVSPALSDNVPVFSQIRITPNPSSTGNFVVENLPAFGTAYQVYTMDGKLIKQGNIMNDSILQLSIQEKGIFVLKLLGADVSISQKLIVY